MLSLAVGAVLLFGLTGCVEGVEPDGQAELTTRILRAGHELPEAVDEHAHAAAVKVVGYVRTATRIAGIEVADGVVLTGTLATGDDGWQYSSEPSDRLVVRPRPGSLDTVIHVQRFEVNSDDTIEAALIEQHNLRFKISYGGGVEKLAIESRRDGGTFRRSIRGTFGQQST